MGEPSSNSALDSWIFNRR